jgi:hypothetical protein
VRVVVVQNYVLVLKIEDAFDVWVHRHGWGRQNGAVFLYEVLVDVVSVEMHVTYRVNKAACFVSGDLGDHHEEQAVARYVERNTKEDVGAALIELEIHLSVLVDVDLEETVTRWERHVFKLTWVPRGDDVATTVWVFFNSGD